MDEELYALSISDHETKSHMAGILSKMGHDEPSHIISDLFNLGHVEISGDGSRCSIARPALARMCDNTLVLCGARSRQTVEYLQDAGFTVSVESVDPQTQPDVIRLEGGPFDDCERFLGKVPKSRACELILSSYRPAPLSWNEDRNAHITTTDDEWRAFDPRRLLWRGRSNLEHKQHIALIQCAVSSGRTVNSLIRKLGDSFEKAPVEGLDGLRLARYACILGNGLFPFKYDDGVFKHPLYAPLPQPITRALTLCSGTLPIEVKQEYHGKDIKFHAYRDVDSDIAEHVVASIMSAAEVGEGD